MKRILYFVLSAFLAVGCIQEKAVTLLNVPAEISFASGASEEEIDIVASGNWSVLSSNDWLEVSPSSGKAGSHTLTVRANANDTYNKRNAEVEVTVDGLRQTIAVVQEGKKVLVLNTNELHVGSEGDEITIPFSTNEAFTCAVDDNCKDWISIIDTKSLSEHSLVLAVAPNDTPDTRKGAVYIVAGDNRQAVTIIQSPAGEFVVTTTSYEISSNGGTIKVPVRSDVEFEYEVLNSGAGWITAESVETIGVDEFHLVLKISANENYDGRIGQVKVRGGDKESIVTVSQGQLDAIIVATTLFEIGSSGGQVSIPVEANIEYESFVISGGEWLSIDQIGTKGLVSSSVVVNVLANEGMDGRSGQIKVVGAGKETVVTITQTAVDELIVGTTSYEIGCEGGQITVPVESNVEYAYEVLSNGEGWIAASKNADGLALTVSPNDTYNARIGQVKITGAGKESIITITQAPQEGEPEPEPVFGPATDLSASGTANSYIVSAAGTYKISTVQGNSSTSVGTVASAEVLWETFGTATAPAVGDLISLIKYEDNSIVFNASAKKGNALIAAKDASGNILWSWHIWLTDKPADQVYNNNAGTMMDRNLGAASSNSNSDDAMGLLYQWGRKDPFMGSGDAANTNVQAKSTLSTWPEAVTSDAANGTIEYAESHPTTFIMGNENNNDWYYSSDNSSDKTRWTSSKTIYDPCPVGYRVPDGGDEGIWAKAFGSSENFVVEGENLYGYSFGETGPTKQLISNDFCWYPSGGFIHSGNGNFCNSVYSGYYWSSTYSVDYPYSMQVDYDLGVRPSYGFMYAAHACSVRCLKENSDTTPEPEPEPEPEFGPATDLSAGGTANSYIVSEAGTYKISAVQGNSSTSVGKVASAEVLWETFGTETAPKAGELIPIIKYEDNSIIFNASAKKGNALIAAKDASGNVLWSWHIWLTDKPEDQVYYFGAGTMMDRNLGATSATPGDVGALGLMYQWGRKDPFLGSSSISTPVQAVSTSETTVSASNMTESNSITGNIIYATSHPTTFIVGNDESNRDWYYSGDNTTDNTRWQSVKTIYDPCPVGYSVPEGDSNGIWSRAFGTYSDFNEVNYDNINKGFNFGKGSTVNCLMDGAMCWYPSAGILQWYDGSITATSSWGDYWSYTPSYSNACHLHFNANGVVKPAFGLDSRAGGRPVRCYKENSAVPVPEINMIGAVNLSAGGTANSYIVPDAGTYKFSAVKGNSSISVGAVNTMEVIWESHGTSTAPNVRDLISGVMHKEGMIYFTATAKKGNALIAAKDVDGNILWSWHIWMTNEPVDQEYMNGAGTMMDRNLGATSAAAGAVEAYGLLYQWGRKDPFMPIFSLAPNSSSKNVTAESTLSEWPSVTSSASTGTIEYAISNPTTLINYNNNNYDWYYSGDSSTDNTRWHSTKAIYDPCPVGYRVPDGGDYGVWTKASGSRVGFYDIDSYDSSNRGYTFTQGMAEKYFTERVYCWYPMSISYAYYWSCTPWDEYAYSLNLKDDGNVDWTTNPKYRASCGFVRCFKENSATAPEFGTVTDLSASGTANSYIVSAAGTYKISTVQGNSSTSVGTVASAEVLWETFGTATAPSVGDLIPLIKYEDNSIVFNASEKKGNALIAAKDADGNILWSWHIWLTDKPEDQVYKNNAGTMMDRNLGATSATPGDVGALGLLYQWGRKDPFLSRSSMTASQHDQAKSTSELTNTYLYNVEPNETNGTIAYATAHPMTFIADKLYYEENNHKDWCYSSDNSIDKTRWQSTKTIYDPCPVGYRVPDGGPSEGVWNVALGNSANEFIYDSTNEGINFSPYLTEESTCWYPGVGGLEPDGSFMGYAAYYTCTHNDENGVYVLNLSDNKYPTGYHYSNRMYANYVRCLKIE